MPELPEVETTLRGVTPHILGARVTAVVLRRKDLRWPITPSVAGLAGQKCVAATRRAKYLLFQMEDATHLLLHLGMSGSLRVVPKETDWRKHDHFALELETGMQLRLHDPRRFGAVLHLEGDPMQHELLANLGPEPLDAHFTPQHLHRAAQDKKVAVKNFIMDAHQVVGVGNIYACESLFMAGIHPERAAGEVSLPRYKKLHTAIQEVLQASITMGGTTLRDFLRDTGEPGYFKQSLRVYDREGEGCRKCGSQIQRIVLGQRSTFFCPNCQR
jgi:formamidopyrimidine-DNA glycosylase